MIASSSIRLDRGFANRWQLEQRRPHRTAEQQLQSRITSYVSWASTSLTSRPNTS